MGDLISPPEAARILKITEQWVTMLLRKGELKGQKVGHRWVIELEEVLAYKTEREAQEQKTEDNK